MNSPYYGEAVNYLDRALKCLEEEDSRFIFYAALELRCCVEARQNAYLEAQSKYRRSLPQRFRIGNQSKELNRIYREKRAQVIDFEFNDGFKFETRYVPVSTFLKKGAERLSQLLHSQEKVLSEADLEAQRENVKAIWYAANECVSGNSMTPALMNKDADGALGTVQSILVGEDAEEIKDRFGVGARVLAKVRYEALTQPAEE